jgi:hypothetical protein
MTEVSRRGLLPANELAGNTPPRRHHRDYRLAKAATLETRPLA